MSDLFERLETLQAEIDALQPGAVRDELQSDLDLVAVIIERLPHRIADAIEWQDAYDAGRQRARRKFIQAVCTAFAPPPKPSKH